MTQPLRPPIAPAGTEPTKLFIPPPAPWYKALVPCEPMPLVAGPVPSAPMPVTPYRKRVVPTVPVPSPLTVGQQAREMYSQGMSPWTIAQKLTRSGYPPLQGFTPWTPSQVRALLIANPFQGRRSKRPSA